MLLALMARQPVSTELWRQLQPLIPAFTPSVKGGARKLTVSDEAALNGLLFVLQTGIPWEDLPQSLGYGSGMTCWRRLRDWNANGVWQRLHQAMLVRLREHDQIDWSRASIDGSSVPSPRGAGNGPQPDGQGQAWQLTPSRHGWPGIPMMFCVTGDNRHDSVVFDELVDALSGLTFGAHHVARLTWQMRVAPLPRPHRCRCRGPSLARWTLASRVRIAAHQRLLGAPFSTS